MRTPRIGKPRTASGAFSLSRKLPRLSLPLSAPSAAARRPKPQVNRVRRTLADVLAGKR